jgi:hypothetical protein
MSSVRVAAKGFGLAEGGDFERAQSPIMGTTITIARLKLRGYIPLTDLLSVSKYHELNPIHF